MAYIDLDKSGFDPDLHLPIHGRTYTIPAPDWDYVNALRTKVFSAEIPPLEQMEDNIKALGPAFPEMVADHVPWPMILHAGRTAMVHWVSPELGEIHWKLQQLGTLVDLDKITDFLEKNAQFHKSKS